MMNDTTPAHADALGALRAATAERHELLDTGLPLAGPAPTLDDYRSHLRMLRTWLAPIEDWLASGPGPRDWLAPLRRVPLIDADLQDKSFASEREPGPGEQAGWPHDASPAYRWGVAYVAEGSQLGGAVLYQRLAAQLAPHPLAYLRGEAAGPGPRWRSFMLALRENVRSEEEVAEACAGARDAFDRILALR
ncbi:MAG TPA: biliverdin-producing heme oxygenase [Telluria sp.]